MKVASLFIAVVALSSCVAKPWMVGSVNDRYGPPKLEESELLVTTTTTTTTDGFSSSYSSGETGSAKNPVGKTGIHPNR